MSWARILYRVALVELVLWYLRPHWWDRCGGRHRRRRRWARTALRAVYGMPAVKR